MALSTGVLALAILCMLGTFNAATKPSTDSLVAALRKRAARAIQVELSVKELDVNYPDSSRRLPLVEAVRYRDYRSVAALLAHGALAKSHEPVAGVTPLHLAFQSNLALIARALLAHGADPDAKDKTGLTARTLGRTANITALLAMYDARGALAFEAPPGTWLKEGRNGSTYYWSPSTGESRWTPPPSCAWQRITVQGQPIRYINSVTGQQVTATPPALSWAKVRSAEGVELWLNWASHVSAVGPPAELPADMAAELARTVNARWYNPTTGTYTYTDPAYSTVWRELRDEETSKPFYFNIETGESVWEAPVEMAWTRLNDTDGGASYFFNHRSGEVSWQLPTSGPLSFVRVFDFFTTS